MPTPYGVLVDDFVPDFCVSDFESIFWKQVVRCDRKDTSAASHAKFSPEWSSNLALSTDAESCKRLRRYSSVKLQRASFIVHLWALDFFKDQRDTLAYTHAHRAQRIAPTLRMQAIDRSCNQSCT